MTIRSALVFLSTWVAATILLIPLLTVADAPSAIGKLVPLRDWISGEQPANDADSSPCLIKGNISSSGERIYHVPGGMFYDRTRITTGKGERWFCTQAEALAAGWRPSRR